MTTTTELSPPLTLDEDDNWPDETDFEEQPQYLDPKDWPQIDHLITEDETPVDNMPSAKQQRLLVEPLYTSWYDAETTFVADANIGIFFAVGSTALVPDMFLSLDVQIAEEWWHKRHRSYFIWEFGKPPEVVVEIVSNKKGGEDTTKMRHYARIKIAYYVIFDPQAYLSTEPLRIYELIQGQYVKQENQTFTEIGLGLTLWTGSYENKETVWLRWCYPDGRLILTGNERAQQEYQRAQQEHQRAERLAAKLRELGIDPDSV